MSRNRRIVLITSAALVFAVAVLLWLSKDYITERKSIEGSGAFFIATDGARFMVTMDDLAEIGSRVIDANYKTNLMPAVQKKYTGVSLNSLLNHLGVDYSAAKSVSFSAADGYVSAAPISDAMDEDNCFIVFEENGKPLGTRESGGLGPYMVVFARDRFSQRWCKYLLEVTLR